MLNYMKWELKSYFTKNSILYLVIGITFLLTFILFRIDSTFESTFASIVIIAYAIFLFLSIILSCFEGTKRTVNSFEKPTFLLESMIPTSPLKLTIAKYIISLIINFTFIIIYIIGILIAFNLTDLNELLDIIKFFTSLDINQKKIIFTSIILLISWSIALTAFISLCFVTLKCLFPNKKFIKGIAYVLGTVGLSYYVAIFEGLDTIIISLFLILLTIVCLFATVKLIENKLEIYN